jgi:ankyrin repeat protein/catechol 2,3-dioxygenase-like lactoylglutathione lyase family enzyme
MSMSKLPERASLEYLKKVAKERLRALRREDTGAKLAAAQLAVARDYGFSSWRALKAAIDQQHPNSAALFFDACAKGDVGTLAQLLADDPGLARITNPEGDYAGWTGLHTAAQGGHGEAVKLLLRHGADPNAREAGDNTYPLHWAAANRHLEIVRALLEAGGDPHGIGDVHELDAIGWATFYHEPGGAPGDKPEVAELLVERGARHHILSAISLGDAALLRKVAENPKALERRTSRFEGGQTALHFAMNLKRYDLLDLLIEAGANLEMEDQNGHTALAWAMMRGDREAMRRLHAAGAKGNKGWTVAPAKTRTSSSQAFTKSVAKMAGSITGLNPMIGVPDVNRTLEWYAWLGFEERGRFPEKGQADWGLLEFGAAQFMLRLQRLHHPHDVTLWFYAREVEQLYQLLKSRQIQSAQAALAGGPEEQNTIEFVADIHDPPYGGREFGIRDLNGYVLYFRRG